MYYAHFGLTVAPFSPLPPLDSMFMGPAHREAFAVLRWGLEEPAGFTMLTGEAGTGKTTLIHALLASADERVRIAHVPNPRLSFNEMLSLIAAQIGGEPERPDRLAHLGAIARAAEKNRVAIVFDEAQQLDDATMENLRLLSQPLGRAAYQVQIILVGQPELAERLAKHGLRQLNQRIGARASIPALSADDAREYVALRVRNAGGESERIFAPAAVRAIVALSGGIPRRIDVLCRNAMMIAFVRGLARVRPEHVAEAAAEYDGTANRRWRPRIWTAGAVTAVGLFAGAAMLPLNLHLSRPSPGAGGTVRTQVEANARHEGAAPSGSASAVAETVSRDPLPWTLLGRDEDRGFHLSAFASGAGPEGFLVPAPQGGGEVMVREGDSLAGIARRLYGPDVPEGVRLLMHANPQIEDADLIYPGQKIRLSPR